MAALINRSTPHVDLALLSRWGGDLSLTADGDIQTVDGDEEGVEKVIRRLFTVAGDYLWEPTYGCGLLAKIGSPIPARTILGLVRTQIFQEDAVAPSPPPSIDVAEIPAGSGELQVTIKYQDNSSGVPMLLQFDTGQTPPGG